MRTLLIDNYDSYTYNLFQVIAEVNGELPLVYYNDEITLEQISSMVHAGTVHSIVISPGPGTPNNPHDVGICLDVLQHLPDVPILGICLGHQALALAHGAAVVPAPEPVHGRLSRLRHSGHELFRDVPSGEGFEVVRYHSLLVDECSLPECLQPVCWTAGGHVAVKLARDETAAATATKGSSAPAAEGPAQLAVCGGPAGEREVQAGSTSRQVARPQAEQPLSQQPQGASLLMGLVHRSRPHYGVQFHPESVATRYGIALLRNFRDLATAHIKRRGGPAAAQLPPARAVPDLVGPPGHLPALPPWPSPEHQRGACLRLARLRLTDLLSRLPGGSQGIFELLYGWAEDTFWLDSAATDRGRFSYMGGRGGPLWRKLTYRLPPPRQFAMRQPETPMPEPLGQEQGRERDAACGLAPGQLNGMGTAPGQVEPCRHPTATTTTTTAVTCEGKPREQPREQTASGADYDSDASSSGGSSSSSCSSGSAMDGPGCLSARASPSATASVSHSGGPSQPAGPVAGALGAGTLMVETADGAVSRLTTRAGLFAYLQQLLDRQRLLIETAAAEELPFNFWGGLVGYLGYELKAECGAANAHVASTPDAVLYVADRLVAVDHATGDVFLLALYDSAFATGADAGTAAAAVAGGSGAVAQSWLEATRRLLEAAAAAEEEEEAQRCGTSTKSTSTSTSSIEKEKGAETEFAPNTLSSPPSQAPRPTANAAASPARPRGRPSHENPAPPTSAAAGESVSGAGSAEGAVAIVSSSACPRGIASPLPQPPSVPFALVHNRDAYLRNIAACHAALHAGESYEVCLTTALTRPVAPDPAALYRTLRRLNPAPYAAWLQCGAAGPTICCSSPERFLRGDRGGLLEARPIKGTAARVLANAAADAAAAAELASSEKERAENLMIVDLLRNDLGRVCEVGTVHVPGLMDIESYATVHQMVSTVRGVRRSGMSIMDCIRAAFPGGSMTGAPKVRTTHIIDALEDRARGVYSGCIGFISFNDTFDLNIVIRTAVLEVAPEAADSAAANGLGDKDVGGGAGSGRYHGPQHRMTIGAGGAIVVQSQPEAEYDEMRLKASALLRVVGLCEGGAGPVRLSDD